MHLFLSPHLDDAALSCGGLIRQLVRRGESVLIRTFMTGDPPQPLPATPLIQDLHQRWAAGDSPYAARRAEDQAAAAVLGAAWEHVGWLDCPYRINEQGEPLYPHNADLFGAIHPQDPLLAEKLSLPPHTQAVYAPLGAGGHVDHQLIKQLASVANFFYEEYPYSSSRGEAARVTYQAGVQQVGSAAVQAALARHAAPLQPRLITLSEVDLQVKIEAIACYRSQLSTFWEDAAEMAQSVRLYAQEVGLAERLWVG